MEGGCSKILLIIINVIFLIFGLAATGAGIAFKVGWAEIRDALIDETKGTDFNLKNAGDIFGTVVIVFGCFIILLSLMGCLGACCQWRVLLGIYGVIVAIILLAQIIGVSLALAKGSAAKEVMNTGLRQALKGYHDNLSGKKDSDRAFDTIFQTFTCCGVDSYKDFKNLSVVWDPRNTQEEIPLTCCKGVDYEHLKNTTFQEHPDCLKLTPPVTDFAYTEGCLHKLFDFIDHYKGAAIGVGVTIFLIELLVCILSFCMCCHHKRDQYV